MSDLPPPMPPPPPAPGGQGSGWREVGRIWLEFLAVLAIALLIGTVVSAVALSSSSCGVQTLVTTYASELSYGVVTLFWVTRVRREPLSSFGVPGRPERDLGVGAGLGAAAYLLIGVVFSNYVVVPIARLLIGHEPGAPSQVPTCVTGGWLLALAPAIVIVAPICEELLFRGFLYRMLRRRLSVGWAATISAATFAALHVYPILMPSLFLLGVALALVYERRRNLVANMALHATFNLIGIILIAQAR